MDTDKAYLFGFIIGGGIFGDAEDRLRIRLPYKQWGSYKTNPERVSEITRDIMNVVNPLFRNLYNVNAYFEAAESGLWDVLCDGNLSELITELESFDICCKGDLRTHVSISTLVESLVDDNLKRRFIAGLADTIGSTNPNHRRFTNEVQIISFELKGFNFSFVCELCRLLYSINCLPDQVLWNHPNFHCAHNPYYKQWNKAFKLRVQVDQFEEFGAVAFKTKAKSLKENRKMQQEDHEAVPCPERVVRASKSCVHPAENDKRLPIVIRGGHYLHNRHVCAVLGCEHAPYKAIKSLFSNVGNLIMPFPILYKDDLENVESKISSDKLLSQRKYLVRDYKVSFFLHKYVTASDSLLFGNEISTGYSISEIMQGVAYLIADSNELNGKRPKGGYKQLIEKHLKKNPDLSVEVRIPDLLTPLIITNTKRGVLIGADNPKVYKRLVSISPDNEYKLCIRPIEEKDLRYEE